MASLPAPGPTSVRIAGDHFQWLFAWDGCVTMLRENATRATNPVVAIGVELDGVGNLDDVVLTRRNPPHTYTQIKYTVDSSTPVNEQYLTVSSDSGGPSILAKIARTWQQLTAAGDSVDIALSTNRAPDQTDCLIAGRDSRTQLLLPRASQGGPRSAVRRARARWATAAGLTEPEFNRLLAVLRFDLARDKAHIEERLQLLMAVTGLRHGPGAVAAGADWVAAQVRQGRRSLTLQEVEEAVDTLGLKAGPVRAVLSIATLKHDPLAVDADYALDWVDRFDGPADYLKRRPLSPATWSQLQDDIEKAPAQLGSSTTISVTGSIRLAPAFLVGATFRMVTGADLAILQRGQVWSTNDVYTAPLAPAVQVHQLDAGDELAVAIAVAADPTDDVLEFLREQYVPVGKLLVLTPPEGFNDRSIPDSATANALAVGIRDALRPVARTAPRVHLFIASPMGLALMLGHRWNRLRPTVVYEDVNGERIYEAAFTISA